MKKEELEKQKNQAYWERDQLVAVLSKIYPSHLAKHPKSDTTWEDDWRTIVCIHIPVRRLAVFGDAINQLTDLNDRWQVEQLQATWHIHDSEKKNFKHLRYGKNHWDGHTTEDKYSRLRAIPKSD